VISSVALLVWPARLFTSVATTAKPLPDSPARAASMVAFSASRLVWPAMPLISSTTWPICCARSASARTRPPVWRASGTAFEGMLADCATCWPMSRIEVDSSSVEVATVATFSEVWSEALETVVDCVTALLAADVISRANRRSSRGTAAR
jgi:hypothetical protein